MRVLGNHDQVELMRPSRSQSKEEGMNPVLDAIAKRRSVRSYRAEPVPKDVIDEIIDAGNWAPTGGNLQRWRFVVVEDRELREKLIEVTLPRWKRVLTEWMGLTDEHMHETLTDLYPRCLGWDPQPYGETLRQARDLEDGMYWGAPVVIFVIGNRPSECWMVCQNMVLAAHSLGLGSCVVGFGARVTGDAEVVEALELQESERIFGPIVFGYPEIYPEPPKKKPPVVKWI